jgi:predicted DNA-binding protein
MSIRIRLPAEIVRQLDALVPSTHASRSQAMRRAIEVYLYRLACERDAREYERLPLTDGEMAFADDPKGWSATPTW